LFGRVVTAGGHVRKCRSGQRVDTPHQCAHEPFDVPTKAGRRRRPIIDAYAVLLTAALERSGFELTGVVQMNCGW
jgi:hypothetical protein